LAYSVYIERETGEISLAEWHSAVEQTDGVRLAEGDLEIVNPKTGDIISIGNSGGDAEVYFPEGQEWCRVFAWHESRASFEGLPSFSEMGDPVRIAAMALAKLLKAQIRGESGEVYC
jgi:hypothetical protein